MYIANKCNTFKGLKLTKFKFCRYLYRIRTGFRGYFFVPIKVVQICSRYFYEDHVVSKVPHVTILIKLLSCILIAVIQGAY